MQSDHTSKTETETYDIYLVPPGEDSETCQSWIRMRNRDGRYNLMFEEWVTDGPFIISPRITFEVRALPHGRASSPPFDKESSKKSPDLLLHRVSCEYIPLSFAQGGAKSFGSGSALVHMSQAQVERRAVRASWPA